MEKSIFELKIGDKMRGFKFGTYQMSITCEKENCTLGELIIKLDNAKPLTVLHVIYGAAVAYCRSKKQTVDFDESDVSDWLDELGFEVSMNLMRAGLEMYEPKNSSAPGEPGPKSTKAGQSETVNILQSQD